MSEVWVRVDEAQRGSLPARCAKTGVRCITRYRRHVSELPAATEWATWTGLWPRNRGVEPIPVVLPLLPSRHRLGTALRRTRDVTAALLPVGLLLVLLTGAGTLGRLAAALQLALVPLHLAVGVAGRMLAVDLRLDETGTWVRFGGVHRDFVATTEAVTTRPSAPPVLPEKAVDRATAEPAARPATDTPET
ncbi:hypothetical protein BH23ACT9_BH23ACT9_04450 [soil metagenome]